jgi:hypothetical protein
VATIAAYTSLEVIVLALAAHPPAFREIKVILARTLVTTCSQTLLFERLTFLALLARFALFSLLFLFLVLAPFGGSCVETLCALGSVDLGVGSVLVTRGLS